MNDIFLGMPEKAIQNTLCRRYLTTFVVETTAQYNKGGIYSAERDDVSRPIIINWGDGTIEQVNGNINQKVHTYASVGEFIVNVSNIKTFAASTNNSAWYNTTSQNRYTFKKLVNLPKAITSIGEWVFCNCSGLTSVTIPNGVTSIGHCAFLCCSGLSSVTIPNSVTRIDMDAFDYCNNALYDTTTITGVTLVDGWVVGYKNGLFSNIDLIGIRGIEDYAFQNCTSLTGAIIGDGVTSIGNYVFYTCRRLTSVTIPSSVTNIGDGAFGECNSLMNVTIPSRVINIGYEAFTGCRKLTNVTIPNSVTSIGDWAFDNCSGLVSVTFDGNAPTVGANVFTGVASGCKAIVDPTKSGWPAEGTTWNGLVVEYKATSN